MGAENPDIVKHQDSILKLKGEQKTRIGGRTVMTVG